MLALSGIHSGKIALPNEPITKARTRFRSHLLDPRSQLDADRFQLKVIAMLCFDATMSELASIITSTAAVLAAVSVRGWGRVVVIRDCTSRPATALKYTCTLYPSTDVFGVGVSGICTHGVISTFSPLLYIQNVCVNAKYRPLVSQIRP